MKETYRHFFQSLVDRLREQHHFTNSRTASDRNWVVFGSGLTGVQLAACFASGNSAQVQVNIDRTDADWNQAVFDRLIEQRAGIEAEPGEPLVWARVQNRKKIQIFVARPGAITDPPETLAATAGWMVERLLAFRRVFGPRLLQLAMG